MPNYSFKDTNSGEQWVDSMSIADKEQYLKDNPHIVQEITAAPSLGDPVRLGIKRIDNGFRDVLRSVKKAHPLSMGVNTHG